MTYEELKLKYQAMLSEVVHLRKENSELKKRLGISNPDKNEVHIKKAVSQESSYIVNKHSSHQDSMTINFPVSSS